MKRGGKAVCQALEAALSAHGLEDKVAIKGTGCETAKQDKSSYARQNPLQPNSNLCTHGQTFDG